MAKTLQDYLGQNATYSDGILSVDVGELYSIAIPEDESSAFVESSPDVILSTLIGALKNTTKPEFNEDGTEIEDIEVAVVSSESFSPKTFVLRGENPQVKHEFVFSVYTEDNTAFNPQDAV